MLTYKYKYILYLLPVNRGVKRNTEPLNIEISIDTCSFIVDWMMGETHLWVFYTLIIIQLWIWNDSLASHFLLSRKTCNPLPLTFCWCYFLKCWQKIILLGLLSVEFSFFFLVLCNLNPSFCDFNMFFSFSYIQQKYSQRATGLSLCEVNWDIN